MTASKAAVVWKELAASTLELNPVARRHGDAFGVEIEPPVPDRALRELRRIADKHRVELAYGRGTPRRVLVLT